MPKTNVQGQMLAPKSHSDEPPSSSSMPSRQEQFEHQLQDAWRRCANPRPRIKEIKECLAFHRLTHRLLGRKKLLIDAAGGHGGLALAFKAAGHVHRSVVADLYERRSFDNLRNAWLPHSLSTVRHQNVDLRHRSWLQQIMACEAVVPEEVAVVACHACSVLADELICVCLAAGVNFAISPCCHGEQGARGEMVKEYVRQLGVRRDSAYDLMRLGVIDATPGYIARLRMMDPSITPMNHVVMGLRASSEEMGKSNRMRSAALDRMAMTAQNPSRARRKWSPAGQGRRQPRQPDCDGQFTA